MNREVALSRLMTKNIDNLTILYCVKCGVVQGVLQGLRKNRYHILCVFDIANKLLTLHQLFASSKMYF